MLQQRNTKRNDVNEGIHVLERHSGFFLLCLDSTLFTYCIMLVNRIFPFTQRGDYLPYSQTNSTLRHLNPVRTLITYLFLVHVLIGFFYVSLPLSLTRQKCEYLSIPRIPATSVAHRILHNNLVTTN
jgi:hypothetical protein